MAVFKKQNSAMRQKSFTHAKVLRFPLVFSMAGGSRMFEANCEFPNPFMDKFASDEREV